MVVDNPLVTLSPTRQDQIRILVGTHHKTGTIWMGSMFRNLSNRLGRLFYNGVWREAPADVDVFIQNNSAFAPQYLAALDQQARGWRGIHVIRDPRDVIVSGCFYHQKSEEKWLHRPSDEFGGRTYQEAINSFGSAEAQLRFEMEKRGADTISYMLAWNYAQPNFIEMKYETLIRDDDLVEFGKVFSHLGLEGEEMKVALEVAYNNSLFGGMKEQKGAKLHLRSGDAGQWRAHFTPALVDHFKTLFPGVLVRLGYEQDDNWTA